MKEQEHFLKCSMRGVNINLSSIPQALEEIDAWINSEIPGYVCFFEANLFHCSLNDGELRAILNRAALVYPDGVSVEKSLLLRTRKPLARVSGPSFMLALCDYGRSKGYRHFFYGGAVGVAEKLAENLQKQFPGLDVGGIYSPPFRPLTEAEEQEFIRIITTVRPTCLWVGLGGPKQEYWMARHLGVLPVPIMFGVGAAFDFHSDNRPWAPVWLRRLGLEWLYRALSGGQKTLVRNIKCVSHIAYVLSEDYLRSFRGSLLQERLFQAPPCNDNPCRHCDGIPCSQSIPYCPWNHGRFINMNNK